MSIYRFLFVVFIFIIACSNSHSKFSSQNVPSHELWDSLLKVHVEKSGLVNYSGFLKDSAILNHYLSELSGKHPNDKWNKKEQLAYWINCYNAFTIKLILENYPLKSIKDIKAGPDIPFIRSAWDIKFIEIEGQKYDLNNIEHSILRNQFDEPRIHFAINCASISCPNLRNEAYVADKLEDQLNDQTEAFLNDSTKNQIGTNRLVLSKIFKWYKSDFTDSGSLIEFINSFISISIDTEVEIDYMDYNWNLNDVIND